MTSMITPPLDRARQRSERLVIVTGPSGAGRSTTIHILEDMGFEAIDNLPLSLVPRLLQGQPLARPMALGIDVRNRDFNAEALIKLIDSLSLNPLYSVELLYLDCSAEVLLRRFSETRRRHPLAPNESPLEGINREFELLAPVRAMATVLIDTSDLTPHELHEEVSRWFVPNGVQKLALSIHSFSYKRGIPRGIDMVLDCRFLRNPYWDETLRHENGLSPKVSGYVTADDRFAPFFEHVLGLTTMLLPAYIDEGKAHLSIGFGCTGGQHRSVAVTEYLAKALAKDGWQVSIRHRELERGTATSAVPLSE